MLRENLPETEINIIVSIDAHRAHRERVRVVYFMTNTFNTLSHSTTLCRTAIFHISSSSSSARTSAPVLLVSIALGVTCHQDCAAAIKTTVSSIQSLGAMSATTFRTELPYLWCNLLCGFDTGTNRGHIIKLSEKNTGQNSPASHGQ